jgi:hypothetical protein
MKTKIGVVGCLVDRPVRRWKCFACSREFTDTDLLQAHEQNDHPNEYYAAMVREIYGHQDGYDFEPNAEVSDAKRSL